MSPWLPNPPFLVWARPALPCPDGPQSLTRAPLTPARCAGLSAVEDLERNDGSAERPYFMSSNLKKLLNKTNKKVDS